jgi:hypothetical protein
VYEAIVSADNASRSPINTLHAHHRMHARRMPDAAVQAALRYGRAVFTRGAVIHAIGRKEVQRFEQHGIELADYEGVQVVCSPTGEVITVYRNRDFRGLRPTCRRSHPGRRR